MNAKQIYQKYLESLWEVLEEEIFVMYSIPQAFYSLYISKREDVSKVAREQMYSGQVYQEPKPLSTFNELVALCESKEAVSLKKSISKDLVFAFSGKNIYMDDDLSVHFNTKIIMKLLGKVERTDDQVVFDNVTNLFIRYCDHSKTYWNIIRAVDDKYGREKSIALFNAMPANIDSFGKRDKLKNYILGAFSKIQKFFGKDCHQFILNFVNKRAKQASASQIGTVDLREALIEFYSGDPDLLEDYKENVPSIKKYLEQTEDGDFFLQKNPRILSRIVDLEEFKAVTSIKANQNNQYLLFIQTFLVWYKAKDERVVNADASITRLNKKDSFISIFVCSKPNNPLPENEFDIKLKSFAKMLNKMNPASSEDIEHLMDKWWDADELERQLSSNVNKKSTKMKI